MDLKMLAQLNGFNLYLNNPKRPSKNVDIQAKFIFAATLISWDKSQRSTMMALTAQQGQP